MISSLSYNVQNTISVVNDKIKFQEIVRYIKNETRTNMVSILVRNEEIEFKNVNNVLDKLIKFEDTFGRLSVTYYEKSGLKKSTNTISMDIEECNFEKIRNEIIIKIQFKDGNEYEEII